MNDISTILGTMEYGPAPEGEGCARLARRKEGRFRPLHRRQIHQAVEKNATFTVSNPANGEKLADVALGKKKDVDEAVKAATAALKKWQALSCNERARHLYALARHVQKHARFLAVLETLDNGKTIRETRDIDIPLVARHFYHHAGWAELRDGRFPVTRPPASAARSSRGTSRC
jgi:aldehyde dehydrogenase (NAD+)